MTTENKEIPSNFRLHEEQLKHNMLLESIRSDVSEIKSHLVGTTDRSGLIMDVDRLKQADRTRSRFIWGLITALTTYIVGSVTGLFPR